MTRSSTLVLEQHQWLEMRLVNCRQLEGKPNNHLAEDIPLDHPKTSDAPLRSSSSCVRHHLLLLVRRRLFARVLYQYLCVQEYLPKLSYLMYYEVPALLLLNREPMSTGLPSITLLTPSHIGWLWWSYGQTDMQDGGVHNVVISRPCWP